ncbi:hypothetical protein C1I97_07885 [Streptomyces sp. NTH33]|uniref:hypothetical protein n=1 Tax=Streptomyces sp. NTH33 TaxID=1735453 RepID=UPI000DA89C52|nr:hypothetical protein [Streptomyces sp. NTH33]PZH15655.1 hypothetical protein C1I97_07885 [Streptomyces sp. NTH33]
MTTTISQDAHAVLLPALDGFTVPASLASLLASGTRSVIMAESRAEYVARAMTEQRQATETPQQFADFTARLRALADLGVRMRQEQHENCHVIDTQAPQSPSGPVSHFGRRGRGDGRGQRGERGLADPAQHVRGDGPVDGRLFVAQHLQNRRHRLGTSFHEGVAGRPALFPATGELVHQQFPVHGGTVGDATDMARGTHNPAHGAEHLPEADAQ